MTMPVPSASESGIFRRGFFTSPAVNVMLFQASAANSDPTCETHNATKSPYPVAALIPAAMGTYPTGDHISVNFARIPAALRQKRTPATISPASEAILHEVK